MTDVAAMLNAYPGQRPQVDEDTLVICIQEALNCAQACTSCADACSADPSAAHLAQCAGAALTAPTWPPRWCGCCPDPRRTTGT
jgi:hypothetical protein